MSAAADLFSLAASALGVAVLNALWQGTLIGAIAAGTLAAMSRRSARARYAVACLALAAMLVAFTATFSVALHSAIIADDPGTTAAAAKAGAVVEAPRPIRLQPVNIDALPPPLNWWPDVVDRGWHHIDRSAAPLNASWLAAFWLFGAALVTVSSVFQFAALRRITAGARFDIRDGWQEAFEAIARDLRFGRLARLGHSAAVEVPTVIGWLAPIVLVPLVSWPSLSRDEMCAILAHELAHIRRRDFLVNVVQKVVEAVLFFHPVTWWLSRRVRVEREYCCDDAAITYTDSALVYARALSQLDTLRARRHDYAMGADGGSLMNRIARIAGAKPEGRRLSIVGSALLGAVVAMVGMAFVVVGNANAEPGTPTPTGSATAPGPKAAPPVDTAAAPDGLVAAANSALAQLVGNGTINQSQATTIEQQVAAGRTDDTALVSSGVVTDAQMQAVEAALVQVKQSFASADHPAQDAGAQAARTGKSANAAPAACDQISEKLAQAVKDGKLTQEQADQQLAGSLCTATAPTP